MRTYNEVVHCMKITISYLPPEEQYAHIVQRFACRLLDGAKVRKSDRHPPFKHIYLTTKRPLDGPETIGAQGIEQKEGAPYSGRSRKEAP